MVFFQVPNAADRAGLGSVTAGKAHHDLCLPVVSCTPVIRYTCPECCPQVLPLLKTPHILLLLLSHCNNII